MSKLNELKRFYQNAKEWHSQSRFFAEVVWQENRRLEDVTEQDFLREHAWVVLNGGFREAVVRKHFDYISLCFCDWNSAEEISSCGDVCVASAMAAFGNSRKLNSILKMSNIVANDGFNFFFRRLSHGGLRELEKLPHIGPITKFHLAKNLGFNVAKPDRHLDRLASLFEFDEASEMCVQISMLHGDAVSTVDLVLWRYAEQSMLKHTQHSEGYSSEDSNIAHPQSAIPLRDTHSLLELSISS